LSHTPHHTKSPLGSRGRDRMFWCYRNGIGNLAVAHASERYDV